MDGSVVQEFHLEHRGASSIEGRPAECWQVARSDVNHGWCVRWGEMLSFPLDLGRLRGTQASPDRVQQPCPHRNRHDAEEAYSPVSLCWLWRLRR